MKEDTSAWWVGAMMTTLGLVGVFLAAGARDDGIYVFGWSLLGFAAAFVFGLVRSIGKHEEANRG